VVEAFNHVVHTTPDVEAVVEISGERLTYAELWERGRGSRWPAAARIKPGDRVAIDLHNGVDWVIACVGILMRGAVVVPVNSPRHPCTVTSIASQPPASRDDECRQPAGRRDRADRGLPAPPAVPGV
jgi:long-chain acyl-CoA synthetase